jgi:DNA repair protein RecN (Recombination protein N)
VTHLPQVASHGHAHYRVAKHTDGKVSRTEVKPLTSKERVEELSRMLGGVEVTARTRAHAAEMIDRAAKEGTDLFSARATVESGQGLGRRK